MPTRFRLYQYQNDVSDIKAGEWVVQKIDEHGNWRNLDGPYKSRDVAETRLNSFVAGERFDDYSATALQCRGF